MASNSKKLYCSNYSSSLPFTLSISFNETSTSTANNTSTLSFSASIKSGGVGFDTNYTNTLQIYWYDNNAYSGGKLIATKNIQDLSKNASDSASGTLTVTHKADGSLSGYAKAVWTRHSSNSSVGWCPASGNVSTSNTALTTIPRASSFTLSGSALGSPVTVNISRASTSFTHKVEWKFGNSAYVTASTNATTSATFTPSTSYASQYPSASSGVLTVRVTTYNGSTQIGSSSTKTLTLTTTTSGSLPTCSDISFSMVNNQIPLSWGVYVQGYSQVIADITGTGIDGSTITGYYISGAGKTVNSNSLTSDVLKNSGEYQFTAYVIDSRGNKSVEKKSSIVVQPYFQPSISVTAQRCTSDGTIDSSGTYINVTCEYNYASVSGKNTITRSVSCNGASNTTFENGTSFVLDANCSISSTYTVTAKIEDALGNSATATYLLSTAERIMNVKKNGKGVAFGGFATKDEVLQSYWDIYVKDKKVSLEDHTHSEYASSNHTHDGYASSSHTHYALGTNNFNKEWIGFYPSLEDALNKTNRKGWIGHDGWNDFFINNDKDGPICFNRTLLLPNNFSLKVKDTSGTAKQCIGVSSGNNIFIGGDSSSVCPSGNTHIYAGAKINFYSNRGGTNGTTIQIQKETSGSYRTIMIPLTNGGAYMGTTNYRWNTAFFTNAITASDLKEKDVIHDFDFKVDDFIMGLKPIAYRRKGEGDNGKRIHMGFGAQEVAKLIKNLKIGDMTIVQASIVEPETIIEVDDNGIEHEVIQNKEIPYDGTKEVDDSQLSWGINYNEFIAPMVAMIQKQQTEIDLLKSEVAELRSFIQQYK